MMSQSVGQAVFEMEDVASSGGLVFLLVNIWGAHSRLVRKFSSLALRSAGTLTSPAATPGSEVAFAILSSAAAAWASVKSAFRHDD